MKHGDKAKTSAKAVQASGKKTGSSKEAVAKTSSKESGSSSKAKTSGKEAGPKAGAQKAGGKSGEAVAKAPAREADKTGGNGKAKAVDTGGPSFANPLVAASFKRAVKKYATAFRRLTD